MLGSKIYFALCLSPKENIWLEVKQNRKTFNQRKSYGNRAEKKVEKNAA